jgi:hypothetical protein
LFERQRVGAEEAPHQDVLLPSPSTWVLFPTVCVTVVVVVGAAVVVGGGG